VYKLRTGASIIAKLYKMKHFLVIIKLEKMTVRTCVAI